MSGEGSKKKLLENPVASGLVVPIAIVLVGALVVFGVTKLLSTERSYKDLVREMHTKTFGNRWVAAFELSKLISNSRIPKEEIPWLMENLSEIYDDAQDPRTRQFTVVAAGALGAPNASALFSKGLKDKDDKVRFHSIIALGNMPSGLEFSEWSLVLKFLESDDPGLVQASALTLATHRVAEAEPRLQRLLAHPNKILRYTAASGLVNYKNSKAVPILKEILFLEPKQEGNSSLGEDQVVALKLSLLNSLKRNQWPILNQELKVVAKQDKSLKVTSMASEVLNLLKN